MSRAHSACWRDLALAAVALGSCACPAFAQGQEARAVRPVFRYEALYDDNVLGLPSHAAALEASGLDSRADLSHTLEAGLIFDKTYRRQHFTGTLKASKTRYDTYKALNFLGRDIGADWHWVLGNRLNGKLGASQVRGLTPFTDFHQLISNVRTIRREYFDAAWELHPNWRARAGVSKDHVDYDVTTQQYLNRTESRSELGVDYVSRSGNSVGLLATHIAGNYPNEVLLGQAVVSNSYGQDEVKANIDWQLTGKTRLQLLAGHVSRTNQDAGLENFDGFNARLTATWLATGKLSLRAALWRETGIVDDLSAIYSVNKGASLAPRWQISDKVMLETQLLYEQRDFGQSLRTSSTFSGSSRDAQRAAALLLVYKPLRGLTVKTSVFRSARSSDFPDNSFTRNGISVSMQQEL